MLRLCKINFLCSNSGQSSLNSKFKVLKFTNSYSTLKTVTTQHRTSPNCYSESTTTVTLQSFLRAFNREHIKYDTLIILINFLSFINKRIVISFLHVIEDH